MTHPDAPVLPEGARVYSRAIVEETGRLLSLLDREPHSASAGSFDREHWAWKFRDFPLGMLQSAVYPLALLWRHPLPENACHGHARVADWIARAIDATLARQHADGAFDAFSPNERDPGPTIGVMHALGEAVRLVRPALAPDLEQRFLDAQRRACDFALDRLESHAFVSNHWALFAVAYQTAFELQGEPAYRRRAEEVIARVLREQSPDGWYREYEGPDPGYESLGIFHLAVYWRRTGSAEVLASLRRSLEFYAHCVHPDGSVGGVYGSRHTSLYFPGGFEILARELPLAGAVARFMRERLARRNVVTPRLSDAENLPSLAYTYLEAALAPAAAPPADVRLPCEVQQGLRLFPDSGIVTAGSPHYYAVLATAKGGVCRVFDKQAERIVYEDAGYLVRAGGRAWTSQLIGLGSREEIEGPREVACAAQFAEARQTLPTPAAYLLLRLLNLTLFRHRALGSWLRKRIVARLILRKRPGPLRLWRSVVFEPDEIRFRDRIDLTSRIEVERIDLPRAFTGIHMGSAKYFHPGELAPVLDPSTAGMAEALNLAGTVRNGFVLRFSNTAPAWLADARPGREAALEEAVTHS